jgi:PAS domain S-box-containing protein
MAEKPRARILNVDDEDAGRYVITKILTQAGYDVIEAATGRDAVRLAGERPDLILLDVNLPDISGFEVCNRIKADPRTASIPVVHISATYVRSADRVVGLEGGADGYLVQPIDPQELVATVRAFLRLKDAEQALRESEEHYRRIVETANEGIWVIDGDSRTTFVNPQMASMLGYTVEEMIGGPLFSFMDEEWLAIAKTNVERRRQGIRESHEFKFRRKDGTDLWAIVSTSPMFDVQGKYEGAFAMITDITERKRAEEALRESEERFRRLSEAPFEGIVFHEEGKIIDANEAFATMFGYGLSEVIGKNALDFATPELREVALGHIRDGSEEPYDGVATRKDGSRFPIEARGKNTPYKGRTIRLTAVRDITERKRAEARIEYQAHLLANVQDAIIATDEQLVVTAWNRAAEEMYGWKAEEVLGRNVLAFLGSESTEAQRAAAIQTLAETGRNRVEEVVHHRRDGEPIHMEVTVTALGGADGRVTGYVNALRNITDRKRAEEEIRSLARFPSENPNPILRVNQDGRILYANESSGPLLADWGCAAGGLAPPPWRDAVRESVASQSSRLADAECGDRIYSLFLTPVPDAGYVNLYGQDITDRKQAEEALRRSEENFRRSLDDSPLGVRIVTTEGETVYANRAILEIYGYDSIEELRTTPVKKRYTPESYAGFQIRKKKRQRGENVPSEYEISIVRKNGEVRHLQVFRKEVLWNGERQFQTIYQDITERKRAGEEQKRLLVELEAKNRELEAFVYTVSHDLKAPLVSLNGFSSVLQKQCYNQLGEEGKHYLERIQANVAHMDALIRNLLELSRIGLVVGPIEEIDVGVLLREIRDELAVRLEEATAEVVVQEPLPTVRADRGRIRQVFANLIDNAVKFRSTERALRIEVGCRQEGDFYRFHVANNGIGIAPQYHEQIFAPFRKLHPEIEGMGMGLALVKKIVEHHGGRIWVESEAGKGSTFYFTIPRG